MLKTLPRSETPSGGAYVDRGRGGETVVLVHGVGMRAEAWGPQIDYLSANCRVIAVDLPGHGLSASLSGAAALPDFVAWFSRFLDEAQLGAVNVAGHSMGALIASGIVVTAPESVRRVALLNGVFRRSVAAREAVEKRAKQIASGEFDRSAPLARWFRDDETGGGAYQLASDLLRAVEPAGYAAAYGAFATGDSTYADCWATVTAPALFLTGGDDLNSTAGMAHEMAAAAPKGTATVIDGHRHMVNLTAPDQVNATLDQWLGSS